MTMTRATAIFLLPQVLILLSLLFIPFLTRKITILCSNLQRLGGFICRKCYFCGVCGAIASVCRTKICHNHAKVLSLQIVFQGKSFSQNLFDAMKHIKQSIILSLFAACALLYAGCEQNTSWESNGAPMDNTNYRPECPKKVSNTNYIYVTHTGTLSNGSRLRNYSMCFDITKYAAQWVAYPLHRCYTSGSAGRAYESQDTWPYDPDISSSYQAKGKSGYSGMTRGHQIPSADRQVTKEMNAQTFYMSNMTPQAYDFNTGIWMNLESRVRSYICNDTLYVVTGAYWENTNNRVGKGYPVPTHYYKVLLRTIKGNTGLAVTNADRTDLKCIGFWLDHNTTGTTINKSYCKSVAEIERLTGHKFFPDVDVDKTQCNPSDWGLN
jgi:DNA/RNA endonuclease G (NUC1)